MLNFHTINGNQFVNRKTSPRTKLNIKYWNHVSRFFPSRFSQFASLHGWHKVCITSTFHSTNSTIRLFKNYV
nr:hypothetical 8.5K protein - phage T4 [Escherichia phage T4]